MAIRINYTPVGALTNLAKAAGRAEQLVREQEMANRNMLVQMQQAGADRRQITYQQGINDRLLATLRDRKTQIDEKRTYEESLYQKRRSEKGEDLQRLHELETDWEAEGYARQQEREGPESKRKLGRELLSRAWEAKQKNWLANVYGPEILARKGQEIYEAEQAELQAKADFEKSQIPLSPEQKEQKTALEHNKLSILQDPIFANNPEERQQALSQIDDAIKVITDNPLGEREETPEEILRKMIVPTEDGTVYGLEKTQHGMRVKVLKEPKTEESELDYKYWTNLANDIKAETYSFTTDLTDEKGKIILDEDGKKQKRFLTEKEIRDKTWARHQMLQRLKNLGEQQGMETALSNESGEKPTKEELISQALATTNMEERRRIFEQGKELGYWE